MEYLSMCPMCFDTYGARGKYVFLIKMYHKAILFTDEQNTHQRMKLDANRLRNMNSKC